MNPFLSVCWLIISLNHSWLLCHPIRNKPHKEIWSVITFSFLNGRVPQHLSLWNSWMRLSVLSPRPQNVSTLCSSGIWILPETSLGGGGRRRASAERKCCFRFVAANCPRYPCGRQHCGRCIFLWIGDVLLWLSLLANITFLSPAPDSNVCPPDLASGRVCVGEAARRKRSFQLAAKPELCAC